MNRTSMAWLGAGFLTAGLWGGVAAAQKGPAGSTQATAWVHVRVEEAAKASKVSVNLPMPVVEAALRAAPDMIASHGRIKLGTDKHCVSLAEMRRIWQQVKNTGEAELLAVEEKHETVKVTRRGELVQVRVTGRAGAEEVHVDLPVSVVDAALLGEGDNIDVKGLVRELQKSRGDIVRVSDKDSSVRIWIDEAAGGMPGGK